MRRLSVIVSPLAATTLLAAGCGGSTSTPSDAVHYATNGTFVMATTDIGSYDPYSSRKTLGIATLAYDSLVYLGPDGRFASELAKTWTADANSATFVLRQGITCSDGTPLTASQVAADLNYVRDQKNSPIQYGTNVPTVGYTATGDDSTGTVRIAMGSPFGFLLNTLGQVPIVCAAGMKDRTRLATGSDGTGPFVLTKVVPGQSYTFTVRKGYTWGPNGASTSAPGTPATVVLKVITNETTAANLMLTGQLNFVKITGQDRGRLAASGLDHVDWPLAGAWLSFNQAPGRPTDDRRVRQALVGALDFSQIIKVSTDGTGSAATGLVSMRPRPCATDTVSGQLPRFDPSAAGAGLDAAGWTKGPDGRRGKDGKPLTISLHYITSNSSFEQPTAELLAEQWKSLGVTVSISADSGAAATQALHQTSNWDVYLIGYNFSNPSQLVPYLSGPTPPAGDNIAYLDNAQYNQLAATALTFTAPAACPYWDRAEHAIISDVDVVPISNRADHWFLRGARAQIQRYDTPIPTTIRVFG